MTSAQVVETSVKVTTNSPSQDYTHPDDHNLRTLVYSFVFPLIKLLRSIFTDSSSYFSKNSFLSGFSRIHVNILVTNWRIIRIIDARWQPGKPGFTLGTQAQAQA